MKSEKARSQRPHRRLPEKRLRQWIWSEKRLRARLWGPGAGCRRNKPWQKS